MSIQDHEAIGRDEPIDDGELDGEAHHDRAVNSLRQLARKHDEERREELRELRELDRDLGIVPEEAAEQEFWRRGSS
jgi:hypothetical protein